MKKFFILTSILSLAFLLVGFSSCSDSDKDGIEENSTRKITGLVEKGPFITGSTVTVYELDNSLRGTGKSFNATTNDEGAFAINASSGFVSDYVKLSVTGFYFNEYTGVLSNSQITMEAIAKIGGSETANLNVNVLTHLEMPRVLKLMEGGDISFDDAKKQAQKELLAAFLITDKTLEPEKTSITANNTSSEILIAISSILLNKHTDAEFSLFMGNLREDLVDGNISDKSKEEISKSSSKLSYKKIKANIKSYYAEKFGKTVEIGNFELFIDGDGDGKIGESYDDEYDPIEISEENIFNNEEGAKRVLRGSLESLHIYTQYLHIFDGVYTNTVAENKLSGFYELQLIYKHDIVPNQSIIGELWRSAYKSIVIDNRMIEYLGESNHDWAKKYVSASRVYRAYKYQSIVDLWDNVALVTIYDQNNLMPGQTPKAKVLDFIISELENAMPNLPEIGSDGLCSKYFAQAILAKAYLQKEDYAKTLENITAIISSNKFALSADYNAIFAGGSNEALFELTSSSNVENNGAFNQLVKKGNKLPLTRYAEILLIAAECNWKQGNTMQAITLLNLVRARNGKTPINALADIEKSLLEEWKTDLQNEGVWFSTLKRFGKAKEELNIPDHKLLLPIPAGEIMMNPSMIQNPGYKKNTL